MPNVSFFNSAVDKFSHHCYGNECDDSNKQKQQILLHNHCLFLAFILKSLCMYVLNVEKDVTRSRINKDTIILCNSSGQQAE